MEKKRKPSKVIYVSKELISSKAYWDLKGKSPQVLAAFLCRRQMVELPNPGKKREPNYLIKNNGEIIFTYQEAVEKFGLSRQMFSRIIDDLVAHGFIDIAVVGTGICGAPSQYAISDRWQNWGLPEFEKVERERRCSHKFPSGEFHAPPPRKGV